jgi:hypothetical protein
MLIDRISCVGQMLTTLLAKLNDMIHTITIETQDQKEFEQIKNLAQTIGIPFKESHTAPISREEKLRLLNNIHWAGEETGEELNAMIYGARQSSVRDVKL